MAAARRSLCGTAGSADRIELRDVDCSTSSGLRLGAFAVLSILIALYAPWW